MNIKSLLLGSTAALVAVTGARAADAVVVAEPEPVEYVRICDAYGAGFFYIPGTETCLKVRGYVRAQIHAGDDAYTGVDRGTYDWRARALLRFHARSETELGTLRSYAELRYNFNNSADKETEWQIRCLGRYCCQGHRQGNSQCTSWLRRRRHDRCCFECSLPAGSRFRHHAGSQLHQVR